MPRPLQINLARRPFRNERLLLTGYAVLVAGLLAFSAWNGWVLARTGETRALKRTVAETSQRIRDLERRRAAVQKEIQALGLTELQADLEYANGLLAQHQVYWTDLLNRLEAAQPYYVRLNSIAPGTSRTGVRLVLNAEGRRYQDVLEFIDRLEASPYFRNVYPTADRFTERRLFIFTLQMEYFPEGEHVELDRG